jgi:cell division protein FtsW (lipid II flippase)
MARTLKSDKTLFLSTLGLVAASVVMVFSASAVQADAKYQMSYLFLSKQLVGGAARR